MHQALSLRRVAAGLTLATALLSTVLPARALECEFRASGVHGGSVQPMVKADCLRDVTEQRIKALDVYAHCEEGDLGCPVPPRLEPAQGLSGNPQPPQ